MHLSRAGTVVKYGIVSGLWTVVLEWTARADMSRPTIAWSKSIIATGTTDYFGVTHTLQLWSAADGLALSYIYILIIPQPIMTHD